jgi:hypothetical protein
MIGTGSLAQTLSGQYEFWDYYGSYLHDYSGNSRHAEITTSAMIPVLTDRGLYISDGYLLKFSQNAYKDFPTTCIDMVVSVLFYPQTDKSFCLIKLAKALQSLEVCFTSEAGKMKITIEGTWNYVATTALSFNGWRLYTVRFSQVLSNTFLYVYFNGDTNTVSTFVLNSFSFASIDTRWELGSSKIEGFLYQIWWHCQVSISISTLSASMINAASSPCATLYAMTPFKRCLSNELDKFKNSESEDCGGCISLDQSCDEDQICIESCLYKCISPLGCRGVSYPICSTPAPSFCSSIPGTDICYKCNIGWIMSTTTPGICEITVPGCKTFDISAKCTECQPGYYRKLTTPASCILCPDDCEICTLLSGVISCSKCPAGQFHHTSPICVSLCPERFYGSTLTTPNKCSICPSNCKYCTYSSTFKNPVCYECIEGYYRQPTYAFVNDQCYNTCPISYYPDITNPPILCKPCRLNCEICSNSSDCSLCNVGYMLSDDTSTCIPCLSGCRTCLSTTECSQCADKYWLDSASKSCKSCSINCLTCSSSSQCDICENNGYDEVVINGIRTCRLLCTKPYYFYGILGNCVQYSADRLKVTICSEDSSRRVTCRNCLTSELNQNNCQSTLCPVDCRVCNTINGAIICSVCKMGTYRTIDSLSCGDICPEFYFKFYNNAACTSCRSNCKRCQADRFGCEECGNEQSLSLDGTYCVLNCPINQYSDRTGIWRCKSCIPNCEICTNNTNCLKCLNNLYIVTSISGVVSCQTACPPRSYYDSNRVCYYCMDNCDVCARDNSGVLVCSTCSIGFILINQECVELKCDPNCPNCVISNTVLKCELCKDGYFIGPSGYQCIISCPVRYYADTGTKRCVACMNNCESCIEASMSKPTCTLCSTSYIFKDLSGANICDYTTCPVSCTDCTITSPGIICHTCNIGYFMQPTVSKCQATCPRGYYGDTHDNICKLCSKNCEECDMNGCIKCSKSYYIQTAMRDCKATCPEFYYPDDSLEAPRCSLCKESCKICSDNQSCTECIQDFYIQPFGDKNCDIKCPAEFYESGIVPLRCDPCKDGCLECDEFICKKCKDGYYMLNGVCFIFCPDYYFQTEIYRVMICSECIRGCIKCDNQDYCKECDVSYVLFENSCRECYIENCFHCDVINSELVCVECFEGFYRIDYMSKCVSSCPEGYFIYDDKSCYKCIDNCKHCTDTNECIQCLSGYYYDTELKTCLIIPKSECSQGIEIDGEFICSECKEDYYLIEYFEQPCVIECPETYYPNYIYDTKTCSKCIENCRSCSSYEICEKCIDGTSKKETCSPYTEEELAQAIKVKENTSQLSTASSAASISSGAVSYNFNNAWSMMNTVQIFSYLSLLQVEMHIILRDTINSQEESKYIPSIYKDELMSKTQPVNEAQRGRYETTSFILNSRKQIYQLCVILLIHLLVKALSFTSKGKLKALSDKVLKMFLWKIYSRYFIIVYFDILNYALIQLLYVRVI